MSLTTVEDPEGRAVTVWTLELLTPAGLIPARRPPTDVQLRDQQPPTAEQSRLFYESVGAAWSWVDRAAWTMDEWQAWVSRPGFRQLSCWLDDAPVGYAELDTQGTEVELAYFGLLPAFIGQGLGGWLLTEAVRCAWECPETARVWVHTCSLDGPTAMANYVARGFTLCRTETEYRRLGEHRSAGAEDAR